MNAVLVNPHPGGTGLNEATVLPPLGLGYMAAVLEKNSFPCSIIDANILRFNPEAVIERIPFETMLVGITINSFTYAAAHEIVRLIKSRHPSTTVVVGGPVPTAAPQQILEEFQCDGLVRGEGEYAILQIMKNLAAGGSAFNEAVPGAAYRETNSMTVKFNPVVRINNLNELPFPAFHLFPPLKMYKGAASRSPSAPIMTSRGCAFDCSFCSKDIFARTVTFRSAANVLEEIRFLVQRYGIRQLDILDDNFAINRKRMEEILDGVIQQFPKLAINLQSGIRVENIDEELLAKMKRAGMFKLAIGIESADSEVLRLCNKKSDLVKIESVVRAARRMGFIVFGFFIIGLPGETEEAFRRTLDFARRIDLNVANFTMATPFVGTRLFQMVKENGRFLVDTTRNIDVGFYAGKVFYEYEGGITEATVLDRYRRAYKEFYTFPKKLQLLLSMRSVRQLRWLLEAALSVAKS